MTAFDVLERQLHDAAATRRRRRIARPLARVALAVAAVAVALAAVALLDGGALNAPPSDEREVAAPPAPYLSPDPDKIVYVRATSVREEGDKREVTVTEDWHRGQESHRLVRWTDPDGTRWALDHVINADGVLRQINEEGEYRVIRPSDNEDAKAVIAREQAGYLADLRSRYTQGTLDPADHVFAGRPARRYHVPHDPRRVGPIGPDQSYYVDRETGAPLGFTSEIQLNPSGPTIKIKETVDAIELLDPTAENLATLRTLTLKRP